MKSEFRIYARAHRDAVRGQALFQLLGLMEVLEFAEVIPEVPSQQLVLQTEGR